MKLFSTKNIEIVKYCQEYFGFALPSVLWAKRVSKFESGFKCIFYLLCNCCFVYICIVYSSTMFVWWIKIFISADKLGWRLSDNLCYRRQETSSVCSHRVTIRTKDNDHARDEELWGRRSCYLKQPTSHSANRNSFPCVICSTSEGLPVWMIGSTS